MKILAIGAHFDDVELGCGGTLFKHKENNDEIYILVLTQSNYVSNNHIRVKSIAKKEGLKAAKTIGANLICGNFETLNLKPDKSLINYLIQIVEKIQPDIVYTHYIGDQHLDHKAIAECSIIATRKVKKVYAYMSNIYATNPLFNPNYFVDISKYFTRKLNLVDIYESEKDTHLNWRKQLEYFNGLYGLKQYTDFVEPFVTIKERW